MKLFSLLMLGYVCLITQISVVPELSPDGYRPNLIVLVTGLALFWLRDARVILGALLAGLVCEAFDSAIPGTGVLLLTILIWLAYRVQIHFQLRSLFSRFVMLALLSFLFDGLFQILNHLEAGAELISELSSILQQSAGNSLATAVVGLLLLILIKPLPFDLSTVRSGSDSYSPQYYQ
ncbi:hypothetical protein Pan161_29270 [Gimesia algae]|uniref:Rod shape-determining protein MreD n=2 Tax=Gimesia algae TaxID=2527971 RepID=A0A517VE36_9PLAN|nr:hypothetical protein Pan161_29270 [Gimesia algae]